MKLVKIVGLALIGGVLVAGCDRQPQAWEKASTENTVEAYDAYLEEYPNGEHAEEARDRRDDLQEARDWAAAEKAGTPEAYRTYLKSHADGEHAARARERVEVASADRDWKQARSANNAEGYRDYARSHPDDLRASEAKLLGKMLSGIEEGRPRNLGKVRARIESIDGDEIAVKTLDSVKLGSLTVPPREMTFNAESSIVEGTPQPKVGDVVTLYLSEAPADEKGEEARVVGVLALTPPETDGDQQGAENDSE